MRNALPWILLGLAACSGLTPAPNTPPIASGAGPAAADQAADLKTRGMGDTPPVTPTLKAAAVQPGRRLEVVEITVDQRNPTSSRQLAAYLIKPEEWTILSCVQTGPTTKHWKFGRVATAESEKFDRLDPLRTSTTPR